jgi:hypothetical protein
VLQQSQRENLAADYGRALTGWTDALHPPTLAAVAGAGSHGPTTKVAGNVPLQSPVSSPGGNALGCAVGCGRHDRTLSRLGRLRNEIEGSNRANCDGSNH